MPLNGKIIVIQSFYFKFNSQLDSDLDHLGLIMSSLEYLVSTDACIIFIVLC